jgi:aminoglycoside/choline kinase family phosphotransferase
VENKRELQLQAWCESVTGQTQQDLQPVFGDARPWRYYRVHDGLRSLIAIDTMNDATTIADYLAVADAYAEQGIPVPELVAVNQTRGFLLISDLGSSLFLSQLSEANLTDWYPRVFPDLAKLMQVNATAQGRLPRFDGEALRAELALMHDWLLEAHLGVQLSTTEIKVWQKFCQTLVDNAEAQPQVGLHRKFHARNILVQGANEFAYTGFHHAAVGPITYDVVSLLRDCYVRWPQTQVDQLARDCFAFLREQRSDLQVEADTWRRWFDLMGLQRHCYVSGLFARRCERDGNPGYLQDIPRNLGYLHDVAAIYPEFDDFRSLLVERIQPALAAQKMK